MISRIIDSRSVALNGIEHVRHTYIVMPSVDLLVVRDAAKELRRGVVGRSAEFVVADATLEAPCVPKVAEDDRVRCP
jgi:hypothetical protein